VNEDLIILLTYKIRPLYLQSSSIFTLFHVFISLTEQVGQLIFHLPDGRAKSGVLSFQRINLFIFIRFSSCCFKRGCESARKDSDV